MENGKRFDKELRPPIKRVEKLRGDIKALSFFMFIRRSLLAKKGKLIKGSKLERPYH